MDQVNTVEVKFKISSLQYETHSYLSKKSQLRDEFAKLRTQQVEVNIISQEINLRIVFDHKIIKTAPTPPYFTTIVPSDVVYISARRRLPQVVRTVMVYQ